MKIYRIFAAIITVALLVAALGGCVQPGKYTPQPGSHYPAGQAAPGRV